MSSSGLIAWQTRSRSWLYCSYASASCGVILGEPEGLAAFGRCELRRHQQRHEAVLRQLQLVDDLGPKQGKGVAEGREPEAGAQLLGDRRAADQVSLLEDQRPHPATGQVGAVHQAVMAAADHDGVVSLHAHAVLRSGL
jgi:hypothetical protein